MMKATPRSGHCFGATAIRGWSCCQRRRKRSAQPILSRISLMIRPAASVSTPCHSPKGAAVFQFVTFPQSGPSVALLNGFSTYRSVGGSGSRGVDGHVHRLLCRRGGAVTGSYRYPCRASPNGREHNGVSVRLHHGRDPARVVTSCRVV